MNRRLFLRRGINWGMGLASTTLSAAPYAEICNSPGSRQDAEKLTPLASITHYNNYYEFSPDKEAVAVIAQNFTTHPWTLTLGGEVEKEVTLDVDRIHSFCQQERIYRLRCVEGWSMVIPWLGVPLIDILKLAKPLSSARYLRFVGTLRPAEMIGQRRPTLEWPYTEGLRVDEAEHPLTLLATGLYGHALPKQNGAPLRLVVPWKYGYKSIKAIHRIEFVRQPPITTWMRASPREYGFYANVNPDVAHPRWSQRREVRIGETKKVSTRFLNGYADEVSHLYTEKSVNNYF